LVPIALVLLFLAVAAYLKPPAHTRRRLAARLAGRAAFRRRP
jgi:hypothetical protein